MRISAVAKFVGLALALALTCGAGWAAEPPPIKIGEISSYSALPVGTRGYRQGWELARDEINGKGGARPQARNHRP